MLIFSLMRFLYGRLRYHTYTFIYSTVDKIEYDMDLDFLKPKLEPKVDSNVESLPKPVKQIPAVDRNLKPSSSTSNRIDAAGKVFDESSSTVSSGNKKNLVHKDHSNSEVRGKNTSATTPAVPDRKSKPSTFNSGETTSGSVPVPNGLQGEAVQAAAELKQLQELMNKKQVEYEQFKKDKDRMIAEHKARQARLESDQKALDDIQNLKDKQLKETADLMRQKRKIEEELHLLEKEKREQNTEDKHRYLLEDINNLCADENRFWYQKSMKESV